MRLREIDAVWYRSQPFTESTPANPFVRTRGLLTVGTEGLGFQAKDFRTEIRGIRSISYDLHGAMTSPSVEVTFGPDHALSRAYFTDGGLLGFAGLFGGTRRLAGALAHLGPVSYHDRMPRRVQFAIAVGIGGVVLVFLSRLLTRLL